MFNFLYSACKLFQTNWENPRDWSLKEKASRTFHGYIWYFKKLKYRKMMKNRRFWEVLEPIRVLYTSKDWHSYIQVSFRELYCEKKHPDDCSKHYTENYVYGTTFREI